MPKYFSITAVTTTIELDAAKRGGQASFTVTNATQASFGGDAIVVPPEGSDEEYQKQFKNLLQFAVEDPSRHYDPGAAEQITVKVTASPDLPKGSYPFVLRMLLAGGIPEEQYDDAPVVTVVVPEAAPTPPPPRRIPWWLILIGIVVALVILVVVVWWVWIRPGPTPSPSPSASPTASPTQTPTPHASLTLRVTVTGLPFPSSAVLVSAAGPTTFNGFGQAYSPSSLPPGTYTLSATVSTSALYSVRWTCTGAATNANPVTLVSGDAATCTAAVSPFIFKLYSPLIFYPLPVPTSAP